MKPIAYVASPFIAILKKCPTATASEIEVISRTIARSAAKKVRELGYTPLSPILAFSTIYNELSPTKALGETERNEALKACIHLLRKCDLFIWVDTPFSELSTGMEAESILAESMGMQIVTIDVQYSIDLRI